MVREEGKRDGECRYYTTIDQVQPHATHMQTFTRVHAHNSTILFCLIVFHSYSLEGSRAGPMTSSSGAFSRERIVPYWTPLGFGPVEEKGKEEGGG